MIRQGAAVMSSESAIDKYKQGFQEEAREILVDLEATLLALDQDRGDPGLVGQVFRGLHTIKGSGSMFGFVELAAFTHHLENAFGEVREGRIEITGTLVELSLNALDQMKAMLPGATGEETGDAVRRAEILRRLGELTGLPTTRSADAEAALLLPGLDTGCAPARALQGWHIRFTPGPELMRNGSDPLLLLRELGKLGSLQAQALTDALPALGELDPERCYIAWDISLATTAPVEEIRDIFIFAEGLCDVTLEPVLSVDETSRVVPAAADSPTVPVEQGAGFGRRAGDRAGVQSSLRVPTAKLDQFVDLVGELVTVQARLAEIALRYEDADFVSVSEEVERLTTALRENSMSIRMLPIRSTFERFRRLVHDLARELEREVELILEGADTELDKTVIDQLNDPLMHLIRNSMDHGIEAAESRRAAGKPALAKIHLSARHSGSDVLIVVGDDGGGIDVRAVRECAIERGLIAREAQLSESEIHSLILSPGFSTVHKVTDISGRGVGMDVVRQCVEALHGTIHIDSAEGLGTTVTLRIPLTLAIIDGLLVRVGDAYFVLPLANSLECIELTRQDIANANGRHIAHVRGEIIPYVRLRESFDIQSDAPVLEQIMISDTEEGRCGFVVDEVIGDHQTVIKNLGQLYRNVPFVSGATILGNGTLALILDPNRVVQDAMKQDATLGARLGRTGLRRTAPRASPAAMGAAARDGVLLNSS